MLTKQIYSYQIEKRLGEGEMGTLFLGVHTQLHRLAIIEAIPRGLILDQRSRELLESRASLLTRLQHPNIVTFYDFLEDFEGYYLVYEYMEGLPLDTYLKNTGSGLPVEEIYRLFSQVLEAVAFAHQQGIFHGNLKPSHLWLSPDKQLKVDGFGGTQWAFHRDQMPEDAGEKHLIHPYQSPESILRLGLDARSDVYSLGVILWEMLSGRKPYASVTHNMLEQSKRIISEPLPPLRGGVSKLLQAVIERATAKEPDIRYRNAGELRDYFALSKMAADTPSVSPGYPPESVTTRRPPVTVLTPRESRPNAASGPSPAQLRRRNTIEYSLVMLMVAVVTGFAVKPLKDDLFTRTPPFDNREVTRSESPIPPAKTPSAPESRPSGRKLSPAAAEADTSFLGNTPDEAIEAGPEAAMKAAAQTQMEGYYQALRDKDLDRLVTFFDPPLEQFFNEHYVTARELRKLIRQSWKRTPEDRHEVMWETLRYRKNEEGKHIVDYWMNYHYRRANRTEWRKQIVFTEVTLSDDFLIQSMQGH